METIYKLYKASKCQEAKLAAFKILHRYSKSQSYFFSKILIISHSLKLQPPKKKKKKKKEQKLPSEDVRTVSAYFVRQLNKLPTEKGHTPPRLTADKNPTDTRLSPWPASSHLRGSGATDTPLPGSLQIKTQLTYTWVPDLQVHTPCLSRRPFSWVQADNPVKWGWDLTTSLIFNCE